MNEPNTTFTWFLDLSVLKFVLHLQLVVSVTRAKLVLEDWACSEDFNETVSRMLMAVNHTVSAVLVISANYAHTPKSRFSYRITPIFDFIKVLPYPQPTSVITAVPPTRPISTTTTLYYINNSSIDAHDISILLATLHYQGFRK